MGTSVFPNEPYDESAEDDIPELPIPRPGEQRPPLRAKLRPPRLGIGQGGASLTANDRVPRNLAEQQALDAQRFTWDLAAQLTSGMLANPARSSASVKDAMAIFDDFLQEMDVYVRMASESQDEDGQQPARGAYFHGEGGASEPSLPSTAATPATPAPIEKPRPSQPRPSQEYWAMPPNVGASPEPTTPRVDAAEDAA